MKAVFIVHPLGREDIIRHYPRLKLLPTWLIEILMLFKKPKIVGCSEGIIPEGRTTGIDFMFAAIGLTTRLIHLLPVWFVNWRILQAIGAGRQYGARVAGLGAHTACIGDAGITLNRLSTERFRVPVTTGNTLTVGMAVEAAERLADEMFVHLEPHRRTLAVVGANGAIGRVCAALLAPQFGETILVVRDASTAQGLGRELGFSDDYAYSVTSNLSSLREAHVIVTVTSDVSTVIEAEDIAPGTVVVDVARPRDVSEKVRDRSDILVVEGGVVSLPGTPAMGLNFGFERGQVYACMAETMIDAIRGCDEGGQYRATTIGKDIQPGTVQELMGRAKGYGFILSGYRSFERPVSDVQLAAFLPHAAKRHARPVLHGLSD